MSRTWLSIRVELVEGHGTRFWPRPGRIFAAARSHPFDALATAIDDAFARWDRAHLHEFRLADGTRPPRRTATTTRSAHRSTTGGRGSRACARASSSSIRSISATTGPICAPSGRTVSTRWRRSGSCPTCRSLSGAGARSPTSTAGDGTATTARAGCLAIPAVRTCRRCGPAGSGAAFLTVRAGRPGSGRPRTTRRHG